MTPPDTGNIVPSSAKHRPISMIMTAPMTHEKIAAGPAMADAFSAPNSHPEPMIEPTRRTAGRRRRCRAVAGCRPSRRRRTLRVPELWSRLTSVVFSAYPQVGRTKRACRCRAVGWSPKWTSRRPPCSRGSIPSNARPWCTRAAHCSSWPAPVPARPACSRTGSRTCSPSAACGPGRSWRSRSRTRRPAR